MASRLDKNKSSWTYNFDIQKLTDKLIYFFEQLRHRIRFENHSEVWGVEHFEGLEKTPYVRSLMNVVNRKSYNIRKLKMSFE